MVAMGWWPWDGGGWLAMGRRGEREEGRVQKEQRRGRNGFS
jgi:hypothetical protein